MRGLVKFIRNNKMKCKIKNREKVIDDYFSGAMSKAEKEAFDEHSFNCDICFQELRLREETVSLIKEDGKSIFAEYLKTRKPRVKQPTRSNIFNFPFIPVRKAPTYAFAAALVVLLLLGSYNILQRIGTGTDYTYNFDDQVPYPYSQSSLRGDSDYSQNFSEYDNFIIQFQAGISYYLSWEYESAINTWKNMDSTAKHFASQADDQKFLTAARDYYFYKGVSHLALSVTQNEKINNQIRISHRDAAIFYLSNAGSLANVYKLEEINRESSFIEKAYSIDGK